MEEVTVEKLTELEIFQNGIDLVGGAKGLARKVTFITIQEAPDFYATIDGGEFVLTNWYTFRNDLAGGLEALDRLSKIASGIGIKVNRFIGDMPEEYIRLANERDFPLFALHVSMKFREIIRAVTVEINLYQMNTLIETNEYYNYLFKCTLSNVSESVIFADFTARTKLDLFGLSKDLKPTRRSDKNPKKSACPRPLEEKAAAIVKEEFPLSGTVFRDGLHICPCNARNIPYGYLVVASDEAISERNQLFLSQLANIMTTLWLDKHQHEGESLQSLLDAILHKTNTDMGMIVKKLADRGVDASSNVRGLVLAPAGAACADAFRQKGQNLAWEMGNVLPRALFIWSTSEECVVVIDHQIGDDIAETDALRQILSRHTYAQLAVGPLAPTIDALASSIRIARNLASRVPGSESGVVFYAAHLAELALISGIRSDECTLLLRKTIDPILENDRKNRASLLSTLENLIRYEDLCECAKAMHLHVNSIRYRLQKIKDITGCDLSSHRGYFTLTTALTLWRGREHNAPPKRLP